MAHARFLAAHAAQDAGLVRAARAGDSASLGMLLERYRPHLLGLAIRLLGYRRAQAEDAVHDTFVSALTHLGDLGDPAAVGGWLHATLRHHCLMQLRSERARAEVDDGATALEQLPDEARVEDRIESAQLRDWVWSALAQLPEGVRMAMLLRHFGSYSAYEDIAAILGVPVGTVRSRLFDGKARLAQLLLAQAGVRHSDQRALALERAAFFTEALNEFAASGRCEAYLRAHAEDLLIDWSGQQRTQGRHHLRQVMEGDFEDGVTMAPQRVLASGNVTVLEGLFVNPPDDPFHCPPGLAVVMVHEAGRVVRLHLHLAPRPPQPQGALA